MDRRRAARKLRCMADEITARGSFWDDGIAELERMTDRNLHAEAVRYLFELLGDRRGLKAAQALVALIDYFGYAPAGLVKVETELRDRALAQVKAKLSPEDYDRVYHSF